MRELGSLLTKVSTISSVALRDVQSLDRAEQLADVENQQVPIESMAKCAAALSSLSALDEFNLFEQLHATSGPHFLAEMAAFRLYPAHLFAVPPAIVGQAMQARDLEDLRRLIQPAKGELKEFLMGFVGERQRAALEDGGGEIENAPEAMRELCADIRGRLTSNHTQSEITDLFRNLRAA